jgi:hypothetical protein
LLLFGGEQKSNKINIKLRSFEHHQKICYLNEAKLPHLCALIKENVFLKKIKIFSFYSFEAGS